MMLATGFSTTGTCSGQMAAWPSMRSTRRLTGDTFHRRAPRHVFYNAYCFLAFARLNIPADICNAIRDPD
jgi:hypothetical protein